ncbi:hypothetical protein PVAP13_5KG524474 [Panicum virgatum]|uniref:Uncharacterized protein n=1 Tax=Panicum virgatum TaxID=38727 RepID=A0A8T0SEZ6_PANVG|nr:hypothetical protein PVAP13_5KG524474 [Panicum virgatum]
MGNVMGKKILTLAISLLAVLALLLVPCAAARPWNGLARRWSTYAYSAGYNAKARAASRTRPAEVMESTCGRPLGLRFHYESGNLDITDAYKELMRVGPADDETTVLAHKADAMPLRFTNGVDQVTGRGVLYG